MSSQADLRIGDFTLASTRNEVDPTILMLFTEADKRTYVATLEEEVDSDEAETFIAVEYAASLAVVKDRLEFMGFTLRVVQEAFDAGVEERINELERRREDPAWTGNDGSGVLRRLIEREEQVLQEMSLESWLEALAFILRQRLRPDKKYWWDDEGIEVELPLRVRFLLGEPFSEGLWFPSYDFRVFMRAVVEITGTDAQVIYDLSDLAAGEYITHDEDLCGWARRETADDFVLNHKIVVLTEGSSDTWAIEGSLKVLYPHLADYYSFMDFHSVRAPGGAGVLVATIKAFVGAGIVNRIVALFDNDTAARSAVRGLRDVLLPNNVRVMHYPDLDEARDYPTLGPQGITNMNVNGLAGSLELYFGRDILQQPDGVLTAVQWRGYDDAIGQYQGELMNKAELRARFDLKLRECLKSPSVLSRYDWSGMRLIVDRLRAAFHDA